KKSRRSWAGRDLIREVRQTHVILTESIVPRLEGPTTGTVRRQGWGDRLWEQDLDLEQRRSGPPPLIRIELSAGRPPRLEGRTRSRFGIDAHRSGSSRLGTDPTVRNRFSRRPETRSARWLGELSTATAAGVEAHARLLVSRKLASTRLTPVRPTTR